MKIIRPQWPAPPAVVAFSTTRLGGYSTNTYSGVNIANHVGDDPVTVSRNRSALASELPDGARMQWLEQVHGAKVIKATGSSPPPQADACWTPDVGVACCVMTADCLPVLFCAEDGSTVASAHAGWRGLSAGVLEATLAALPVDPARVMAWLGPAIGPSAFEVGPEVRSQFLSESPARLHTAIGHCFESIENKPGFYLADLCTLARIRLKAAGVNAIYGGDWCTYRDRRRFYSYRRDGETGRMATVITKVPT